MSEDDDPVREVLAARAAQEQGKKDARALLKRGRIGVGRAIHKARSQGVTQEALADRLKLTREQLRRYESEYRAAEKEQ